MNTEKLSSTVQDSLFIRGVSRIRVFFSTMDRNLLVLVGLPILFVILNGSWFLSTVLKNYIDPWIYFGYFLDLKQHLNTFNGTYYGTRLPWILPGFLAYRLFPPLIAAYILHFTLHYATTIPLYQILKRMINQQAALLAAILMGCYYFFFEAIGSAYIDGAGVSYLMLTLLMLTPGARESYTRLRLNSAGIFYGCLIYTQLFLTVYTPFIILYYLFINRTHDKLLSLKLHLKHFLTGFLGITLFLCMINYSLNDTFFFFIPILKWTGNFVISGVNPWWVPISTWLSRDTLWILLPTIMFLGSVLTLIFHRRIRSIHNYKFVLFFQVYFILYMLLHLVLELTVKQPVLQLHYYASYLMPALFLAMGSQLSIATAAMNKKRFYWFLCSIIAISCLTYIPFINLQENRSLIFYLIGLSTVLGLGGLISIINPSNTYKKLGAYLIPISLIAINMICANSLPWHAPARNSDLQKKAFLSVIDSMRTVQSVDPQGNTLFWYDGCSSFGSIFRAVASTYLWGYRLINEEFPQINNRLTSRLPALNDQICILSNDPNVVEQANQNLAPINLKGEVVKEKMIQQGHVGYKLTFIKICPLSDPQKTAGPSSCP